ncbi:MAG: hypothetical protein NT007_17245 [Candidatus Kapabacteria bacterium]|nr:hypothetical protein [Candidatus Kapabacteria bacterium]
MKRKTLLNSGFAKFAPIIAVVMVSSTLILLIFLNHNSDIKLLALVFSINSLAFLIFGFNLIKYFKNHEILRKIQIKSINSEKEQIRKIFNKQNMVSEQRLIENTFFNMLQFFNSITESLVVDGKDDNNPSLMKKIHGRESFTYFFQIFYKTYANNFDVMGIMTPSLQDFKNVINNSYMSFYFFYQNFIGHYFRNLYNILIFIEKNELKDRQFLIATMISQLSSSEVLLLFYHCLSDEGAQLLPLVEKFGLLDNIPLSDLIDRRHKMLLFIDKTTDIFEPISPMLYV